MPVLFFELNKDDFKFLKDEATAIANNIDNSVSYLNKFNDGLAGQIEHEYTLSQTVNDKLEKILYPVIGAHIDNFNYFKTINVINKQCPLRLHKSWINLQKKYEFNPIHTHSGVFSFAIWINIPYTFKEEDQLPHSKLANRHASGRFYFVSGGTYPVFTEAIQEVTMESDKSSEGCGVLFPAKLAHGVYPFYTSDEYRISISGNYGFDIPN